MGQLTYSNIISEGCLLAGRDDLSTRAAVWLKAWLRSQYAAWPWPFLQRRKSGIALAQGATSLTVGAGNGGVTLELQKILDPFSVYDSVYSTRRQARIRQLTAAPEDYDENLHDSATWRGVPSTFKVRANSSTWGAWDLIPLPVPDKAYLLAFDCIEIPADYSSDSAKPLYPNDRTLVQMVQTEALKYANGADDPAYQSSLEILASMTGDDRVKYGSVPGTNDLISLDPSVFR